MAADPALTDGGLTTSSFPSTALKRSIWSAALGALCASTQTATAQDTTAARATLTVIVHHDTLALAGASVRSGAYGARTDATGTATLTLPAGSRVVVVRKLGFLPDSLTLVLRAGGDTTVTASLVEHPADIAPIMVTSTRTERRLEEEPLRVEVLAGDDVAEKNEMRPGDLSNLLRELSGVRMQVTSPSLGATSVRLQGLRGQYTLLLSDGLPLFGTQPSGFGLVQMPPLDLRQAEVIKGATSSLYGPAAMGGVVNLISRRPGDTAQALVNQTSRGGTDLLGFETRQFSPALGATLLAGAHTQRLADPDRDGWTDFAGLRRVELRPRLFYDDSAGHSAMVTVGAFAEDRAGGAIAGRVPAAGFGSADSLLTRHGDLGGIAHWRRSEALSFDARASASGQDRARLVNGERERERWSTSLLEVSVHATRAAHVVVGGVSWQDERYANRDVPLFDEARMTTALFVQHTYTPASWLASTVNGRCDASNTFGTICTPRVSLLARAGRLVSIRASAGAGWFAPSVLNEDTETIGLRQVLIPTPLEAERAHTASLDVTMTKGPLQVNGTVFTNVVRRPVGWRPVPGDSTHHVALVNAPGDARTHGGELFAVFNQEPVVLTMYYAATRSREVSPETGRVREQSNTPREEAGADLALEDDESGAYVALEVFYTGRQALDDDPYRAVSRPFTTVGVLASKRLGRATVFVNGENLTNVVQTHFGPVLRPVQGEGGRWTVSAWAPLEGRSLNAGLRWRL